MGDYCDGDDNISTTATINPDNTLGASNSELLSNSNNTISSNYSTISSITSSSLRNRGGATGTGGAVQKTQQPLHHQQQSPLSSGNSLVAVPGSRPGPGYDHTQLTSASTGYASATNTSPSSKHSRSQQQSVSSSNEDSKHKLRSSVDDCDGKF